MQPSQDNRVNTVKKLEKESTVTSSAPQRKIKINKRKIQEKKIFEHIKCYECSKMRHFASHCPTKLKAQEIISKKHGSSIKRRLCYQCKEKGHSAVDCPQVRSSDQGRSDRPIGRLDRVWPKMCRFTAARRRKHLLRARSLYAS